jgi:hypothetical protein
MVISHSAPTDTAWNAIDTQRRWRFGDPDNVVILQDVILYPWPRWVFTLEQLFPSRINTFRNFADCVSDSAASIQPGFGCGAVRILWNGVLKIDSVLDFNQGGVIRSLMSLP